MAYNAFHITLDWSWPLNKCWVPDTGQESRQLVIMEARTQLQARFQYRLGELIVVVVVVLLVAAAATVICSNGSQVSCKGMRLALERPAYLRKLIATAGSLNNKLMGFSSWKWLLCAYCRTHSCTVFETRGKPRIIYPRSKGYLGVKSCCDFLRFCNEG